MDSQNGLSDTVCPLFRNTSRKGNLIKPPGHEMYLLPIETQNIEPINVSFSLVLLLILVTYIIMIALSYSVV